jgi:protein N-terminal amidase
MLALPSPVFRSGIYVSKLTISGYNFESLEAITPFLEPTAAGLSTQWAQRTAQQLRCAVSVGYPEIDNTVSPAQRYNSLVTVGPSGQVVAHYRKAFLYYTDETWAAEGPSRFFHGELGPLGRVSMGICMDINPYRFVAPWTAYEFARAAVDARSPTVVVSMAWLTRLLPAGLRETPEDPDVETLSYWLERLWPLREAREAGRSVVCVMANRSGVEGEACYAGTSTILRIGEGMVKVYGILGKAVEDVLVADLDQVSSDSIAPKPTANGPQEPQFQLRPEG